MWIYRLIRWLLGLATHVFFRHVAVVGRENVPASGPVVFAGNHPNSLIDPVLILTTSGRVLSFAAKDVLFKNWLLRGILRALGAVPIARREDHGEKAGGDANAQAFDAMFARLASGGAVGIFPEGLSHDQSQLARLKTGTARLALGAAERAPTLQVIPTGLTFTQSKRFRSRALIRYGTPLPIDAAAVARWQADPQAEARALTERLDAALRQVTVNAEDWETLRALDAVRRLYQPATVAPAERNELARRFNAVYPHVQGDPRVQALLPRVGAFVERCEDAGVTDRDLRRPLGLGAVAWRVVQTLLVLLVWMPLALPGAVLHAPVGVLAAVAGRTLTPRKDVVATTKLVAGLLLTVVGYAALLAWIALTQGIGWALLGLAALPISGLATLRVLDHFVTLRRGLSRFVRALTLERELEALRVERAALANEVIALVDALRPSDMTPLFPRAATAILEDRE